MITIELKNKAELLRIISALEDYLKTLEGLKNSDKVDKKNLEDDVLETKKLIDDFWKLLNEMVSDR